MLPKVSLELLSLDHAAPLYQLTNKNRQHLREWLPWLDDIQSQLDTEAFIEAKKREVSTGGAPQFAIVYQHSLCGIVGFHAIDWQKNTASIGYWLSASHVGKGIMISAVTQIVEIGLSEFQLDRIEIRCATGNLRSRNVAERAGFRFVSTVKQCEWLYDHYVDHAIYALTAEQPGS